MSTPSYIDFEILSAHYVSPLVINKPDGSGTGRHSRREFLRALSASLAGALLTAGPLGLLSCSDDSTVANAYSFYSLRQRTGKLLFDQSPSAVGAVTYADPERQPLHFIADPMLTNDGQVILEAYDVNGLLALRARTLGLFGVPLDASSLPRLLVTGQYHRSADPGQPRAHHSARYVGRRQPIVIAAGPNTGACRCSTLTRQIATGEAAWLRSHHRATRAGERGSAGALALLAPATAAFTRWISMHGAVWLVHTVSTTGWTVTHELRV